jgi:hypothetical protein
MPSHRASNQLFSVSFLIVNGQLGINTEKKTVANERHASKDFNEHGENRKWKG